MTDLIDTIIVSASTATPTTTGVEGGLDVDVTVWVGDREFESEVTLVPRPDGDGYGAWGDPSHWISGALLRELQELPHETFRAALCEIEAAARAECEGDQITDETIEAVAVGDSNARALVLARLRWRALEGTGADTSHEDPQDWYDAYGWHLPTEREGDVVHGVVAYTDLSETDDDTLCKQLRAKLPGLMVDEASAIVARARDVRGAADTICGLLDTAEERWEAGDIEGCIEALTEARREELDHGDSPATDAMASALFGESVWAALR